MSADRGSGWLSRLFGRAPTTEPPPPGEAPKSPTAQSGFVPVNELEHLLMVAGGDPAARPAFQRALLEADLLVATPKAPAETGIRTLERDETLSIMTVPTGDAAGAAAIFTSEQRLADCFGPGSGFVALNGHALFEIVASGAAVLNPGSDYGVQWSSDDIQAMLGRPVRRTLAQETSVLLGSPAQRPERLIAALARPLADDARIAEAWLALAHWPDAAEAAWYLDIRATADADAILPGLAAALVPANLDGRAIDVIVNPPADTDAGTGIRLKSAVLH